MKRSCIVILTVFLFAMFLALTGQTQILNIDKSDTLSYSIQSRLNININCGLEIDKQKKTLYDASNTAEILLQKNHELYILSSSYRFTYNGPDDFLNAGYIHLRFRHNYKNKLEPEAFLQYQFDNTRGLVRRALAGANYRYNFWKADKIDLNAGAGLMMEHERWNYAGVDSVKVPLNTTPIENSLLKMNSYIRFDYKSSANSDLAFSLFLQSRFTSFHPRIAPSVQWNVAAGKHVGISVAFNSLYDTQPVVPISHFYFTVINSMYYKL